MRRRGVLLSVVVAALLLGCTVRPPPIDLGAWQAPRGREHPLVGRIWDTKARRFVTSEDVVARLTGARYVLLGERHDHPDHHRVQTALVRALLAAGRRPAVVFEMFTADDTAAIARHLAAAPRDAAGLAAAVDWARSGWPDWAYYEPIAQAALDAGLPIVAGNLAPSTARALARGNRGALPDGLAARYALDQPLPDGGQAALTSEIYEAHCGHIPADRMDGMVLAQRARDAALADAMLAVPRDGAVLIAGAGHVRTDRGVPTYLRARAPDASIAALTPLEVRDGWTRPEDYATADGGRLPYDWVWFTPRMADGGADPCASFRRAPAPRS
jgi:uncharacterized iron-regulated protein